VPVNDASCGAACADAVLRIIIGMRAVGNVLAYLIAVQRCAAAHAGVGGLSRRRLGGGL